MAYRNKTYICFDADNDMDYYNMMKAWKAKNGDDFNFHNAHDIIPMRLSKLDDNDENYIKGKLRERFKNSKALVVLVGEKTKYLYKYVRWEIEVAIKLDLPIIVVNINKKGAIDKELCPPILRDELAIHIPYKKDAIRTAMADWEESHKKYRKDGKTGPYHYKKYKD